MDPSIQRALNDKLYDKRKLGALDLERAIRDAANDKNQDKIKKIIQQLCNDFAYAVHQPHARNGGLIGLAAAAIALGPDLATYLDEIVPPVLACFTDQDARVRYYACESMYNIAKVAKGEVLPYFNDIFDALCKLGADSELSVKNGAELLDRLIKDIVSESAATYVSILHTNTDSLASNDDDDEKSQVDMPMAFSLAKFIPLLKERIFVLNPFTRTFLVGWITLLDSIPDLELVVYLPEFLDGLFRFLSDGNHDVQVATVGALERFLTEIKRISRVKKGIAQSKRSRSEGKRKRSNSTDSESLDHTPEEIEAADNDSTAMTEDRELVSDDDWIPGQDVNINYKEILVILTTNLDALAEEDCLLESLRWIVEFLDICPEEVLPFTPKILAQLLPAMANTGESIRAAAGRVNTALMDYVVSLSDDTTATEQNSRVPSRVPTLKADHDNRDTTSNTRGSLSSSKELDVKRSGEVQTPEVASVQSPPVEDDVQPQVDLDYGAAVNSLTLLFLNDHEATRVAALTWLLMLHRKAPKKVLAFNDGTFPALLKTLSDTSEAVVTRDLQLLSQISRHSDDDYFSSFMVNLLQLFSTDRKLLETRGNLIIRQLCMSLSAERIYRTLADCIEREEDVEFASIMVQNLNNNLITAPELQELRKRLRNLETRDGQTFFMALFRSWCYNAVATFSLCLLAQAYEQAYNLLQIFAELEMTVNMLIQIDKLVQLLESPVFTYLRLQLLEPERFPYLYKCLYGLLMLLPQSSAFAALKNRLNSISAIGYLHAAPRTYVSTTPHNLNPSTSSPPIISTTRTPSVVEAVTSLNSFAISPRKSGSETHIPSLSIPTAGSAPSNYDRATRIKSREDIIKWTELLEKFKATQEKARRTQRVGMGIVENDDDYGWADPRSSPADHDAKNLGILPIRTVAPVTSNAKQEALAPPAVPAAAPRKSGIGRLAGRLGGGAGGLSSSIQRSKK